MTPVKPDPDGRQYLVLNSSGNVLDLIKEPPSLQPITSDPDPTLNIQFPATLPSGLAPDDELLDGSRITVAVNAFNSEGITPTLFDSMIPGTAFESLTTAEQEAAQQQVKTYPLRKAVKTLLDDGFTQADIDAVL